MSLKITVTRTGDLKKAIDDKTRAMLINLHGSLVLKSPVDEGTFEGAWTLDLQAKTIENNLEYAEPLADGHSSQASKGWVELEIDAATRL